MLHKSLEKKRIVGADTVTWSVCKSQLIKCVLVADMNRSYVSAYDRYDLSCDVPFSTFCCPTCVIRIHERYRRTDGRHVHAKKRDMRIWNIFMGNK